MAKKKLTAGNSEGWAWPMLASRAHFFREGRSLCGNWLFTGELSEGQELGEKPRKDDCKSCWRKRHAELEPARQIAALKAANEYVAKHYPLPRCGHNSTLRDHSGEVLEPPCGCRACPETDERGRYCLRPALHGNAEETGADHVFEEADDRRYE